jgi:hypothetical protein
LTKEDLRVDTGRYEEKWKTETIMEEPIDNFMRRRNMEEDIAEDRHLWRLGMDRRLLAI